MAGSAYLVQKKPANMMRYLVTWSTDVVGPFTLTRKVHFNSDMMGVVLGREMEGLAEIN